MDLRGDKRDIYFGAPIFYLSAFPEFPVYRFNFFSKPELKTEISESDSALKPKRNIKVLTSSLQSKHIFQKNNDDCFS